MKPAVKSRTVKWNLFVVGIGFLALSHSFLEGVVPFLPRDSKVSAWVLVGVGIVGVFLRTITKVPVRWVPKELREEWDELLEEDRKAMREEDSEDLG